MANRKISELTALTTPASGDYLPIVDISEAADADKNKRITIEELMRGAPNGTAAAPGIAFEGDPDTGIYSPGANQVAISTNGVGRLSIDASGNVGIGNVGVGATIHGGLLHVNESDTSAGASYSIVRLSTTAGGLMQISVDDKTAANPGWRINTGTDEPLAYLQGGLERARIDSSGRLLVGTSSNSGGALLQVNGDRVRVATAKTPASASATGTAGEICWDANYVYVCVATNTWKRSALSTW